MTFYITGTFSFDESIKSFIDNASVAVDDGPNGDGPNGDGSGLNENEEVEVISPKTEEEEEEGKPDWSRHAGNASVQRDGSGSGSGSGGTSLEIDESVLSVLDGHDEGSRETSTSNLVKEGGEGEEEREGEYDEKTDDGEDDGRGRRLIRSRQKRKRQRRARTQNEMESIPIGDGDSSNNISASVEGTEVITIDDSDNDGDGDNDGNESGIEVTSSPRTITPTPSGKATHSVTAYNDDHEPLSFAPTATATATASGPGNTSIDNTNISATATWSQEFQDSSSEIDAGQLLYMFGGRTGLLNELQHEQEHEHEHEQEQGLEMNDSNNSSIIISQPSVEQLPKARIRGKWCVAPVPVRKLTNNNSSPSPSSSASPSSSSSSSAATWEEHNLAGTAKYSFTWPGTIVPRGFTEKGRLTKFASLAFRKHISEYLSNVNPHAFQHSSHLDELRMNGRFWNSGGEEICESVIIQVDMVTLCNTRGAGSYCTATGIGANNFGVFSIQGRFFKSPSIRGESSTVSRMSPSPSLSRCLSSSSSSSSSSLLSSSSSSTLPHLQNSTQTTFMFKGFKRYIYWHDLTSQQLSSDAAKEEEEEKEKEASEAAHQARLAAYSYRSRESREEMRKLTCPMPLLISWNWHDPQEVSNSRAGARKMQRDLEIHWNVDILDAKYTITLELFHAMSKQRSIRSACCNYTYPCSPVTFTKIPYGSYILRMTTKTVQTLCKEFDLHNFECLPPPQNLQFHPFSLKSGKYGGLLSFDAVLDTEHIGEAPPDDLEIHATVRYRDTNTDEDDFLDSSSCASSSHSTTKLTLLQGPHSYPTGHRFKLKSIISDIKLHRPFSLVVSYLTPTQPELQSAPVTHLHDRALEEEEPLCCSICQDCLFAQEGNRNEEKSDTTQTLVVSHRDSSSPSSCPSSSSSSSPSCFPSYSTVAANTNTENGDSQGQPCTPEACSHLFHDQCLYAWVCSNASQTCPCCRVHVSALSIFWHSDDRIARNEVSYVNVPTAPGGFATRRLQAQRRNHQNHRAQQQASR